MVINDVEIDMDERVWRELLALPYAVELTPAGRLTLTPLQGPGLTFEQLAGTHPILPNDLHWKVETNARSQIIMSPSPGDEHQDHGYTILALLGRLMTGGRPFYETGVKTSDGTRIPDVGWISRGRRRASRQQGQPSFSVAPEICVEILSPSNNPGEIEEKKCLYLEAGALEVWTCDKDGTMKFFDANGPLPASLLCPEFPARVLILD